MELICSPINRHETQSLAFIQLTILLLTSKRFNYIYSIRMAVRFPDIPQAVYPAKTQINYCFDHLIACVKEGQAPGELWNPNGVAIAHNNKQIYVTYGLGTVYGLDTVQVAIFSETGEFLKTFSHPDMKRPWGIAIYRDNVYVTDTVEHTVFHFKMETDFPLVARIGNLGSGIRQFNEPRQLTVSRYRNLFVTDYKNDRLKILDSKLHYRRHISHLSMKGPIDVKLTQDEMFVLCESSPCIKIFSYPGDLKRSLVAHGDIGMQVLNLSCFCMDAEDNFLICDSWGHQIKIFSKKGTLLHTLGKYGNGAGMFHYPRGIALINNQKLVIVSINTNYSLQIFF